MQRADRIASRPAHAGFLWTQSLKISGGLETFESGVSFGFAGRGRSWLLGVVQRGLWASEMAASAGMLSGGEYGVGHSQLRTGSRD